MYNIPEQFVNWNLLFIQKMQMAADGIANNVDPDQTAPDLGLHCLPKPVCLNI